MKAIQAESKKEFERQASQINKLASSIDKLESTSTQILISLAKIETNIEWMRGDHAVVN
jgi:Asp-tRNA(Asn)/Glu-tRNA(Gln) amidotransferase C subunit